MTQSERAIVIGAGAGGLAAAIELTAAGYDVCVIEAANTVGGKMNQVVVEDHRIDTGPTVFTMRWVFESLFATLGYNLDDELHHSAMPILARHWWHNKTTLDLHADIDQSADAIGQFASSADAAGYRRFCADSESIHDTLRDTFMAAQKPNPLSLVHRVGWHRVSALIQTRSHQTLWHVLSQYFRDPRLQQLFGRYATYVGSSPLQTPATLMLIAHVEQAGVWRLEGGMSSLADAMQRVASSAGASFRLGERVDAITTRAGRVDGVITAAGEKLQADVVLFNGDNRALLQGLLGQSVQRPDRLQHSGQRGLSAITWSGLISAQQAPLSYHNVLFQEDYPSEFKRIFHQGELPHKPTVYVCAQDRERGGCPSAQERALVLINAPSVDTAAFNEDNVAEQAKLAVEAVIDRCGLDIKLNAGHVCRTPQWYSERFPGSGGSLYGWASHGMWSSFTRPGTRTRIPGLYRCGGSVHPGPGVPMATLSGRLAAWAMIEDRG